MPVPDLEQQIVDAARQEADRREWPWDLPVRVTLSQALPQRIWSVLTNANAVGRNVRIDIRESDLAIINSKFLPR